MSKAIKRICRLGRPGGLDRRQRESGMVLAEYAIGIVAVIGLGVFLWGMMQEGPIQELFRDLVGHIFGLIKGIGG